LPTKHLNQVNQLAVTQVAGWSTRELDYSTKS